MDQTCWVIQSLGALDVGLKRELESSLKPAYFIGLTSDRIKTTSTGTGGRGGKQLAEGFRKSASDYLKCYGL